MSNTNVQDLMRLIRGQMESLINVPEKEIAAMRIGLAHSLSRYKLKFSPDKVDTMIVQAICEYLLRWSLNSNYPTRFEIFESERFGIWFFLTHYLALLDDLDKELNNYIMRCKEWYGWHFPEMSKIVQDNLAYCKTIKKMGNYQSIANEGWMMIETKQTNVKILKKFYFCNKGYKTNAATIDMSDILPEDVEQKLKEAAEVSMGTEISEEDLSNITNLCDQVLEISDYRDQLYEYLKNRMTAIAPNLTALVGELVGARLISHAGKPAFIFKT